MVQTHQIIQILFLVNQEKKKTNDTPIKGKF